MHRPHTYYKVHKHQKYSSVQYFDAVISNTPLGLEARYTQASLVRLVIIDIMKARQKQYSKQD